MRFKYKNGPWWVQLIAAIIAIGAAIAFIYWAPWEGLQ